MEALDPNTVESSELVSQTFEYWFNDHNHIRSPFPEYIRERLKRQATDRFFQWASKLNTDAAKEINEVVISEKFEGIIFETAIDLVNTEDERITILYPFLLRKGDRVQSNQNDEKSIVIDRSFEKDGDLSFLRVKLKKTHSLETWETRFELPA